MNESDDSHMKKKGINMNTVRKVMVGLQADSSSDEDKIPPTLGSVVNSPSADIADITVNP